MTVEASYRKIALSAVRRVSSLWAVLIRRLSTKPHKDFPFQQIFTEIFFQNTSGRLHGQPKGLRLCSSISTATEGTDQLILRLRTFCLKKPLQAPLKDNLAIRRVGSSLYDACSRYQSSTSGTCKLLLEVVMLVYCFPFTGT